MTEEIRTAAYWPRFEDDLIDQPRVAAAGVLGFAVHCAALAWCARNRTTILPTLRVRTLIDFTPLVAEVARACGLPEADERELVWEGDVDGQPSEVAEPDAMHVAEHLVQLGLWSEIDDGFVIHDAGGPT